ncbi:MAG: DNA polymerase III subunit beta [Opitutae bacterium]|jgi:DNA polymerase-3 subunit beta|nr:DNA polymerase III subunit beta [Opitutae bacterium]MBT4225680.1 DNA polymerase III subunit beta [Opitutae bacterium]MBT5379455.1 DNA polymerase III subunit beta [Opitutae bacterium]MBT5690320.1 DNA polymerase III subunit beta [Opitutae bacterium]MBT6462503.1 DNA polymerase III subunit beta [Opitutae bacterium]
MKFKINRDHFSNGLQQVSNVVSLRPTMPILSNVLIEATGDQISLTTTNLDLGTRCTIKADVETEGTLTLPVRKLASIVRDLPSMEVLVEALDAEHAKISAGSSKFRMTAIGVSEFPPLPVFENNSEFTLEQANLQNMLKSISYAQSSDETRHMLNGVYFNFDQGMLTLVATDGKRLALNSKEMEIPDGQAGNFILPMKTVSELERLLGKGKDVKILFNERQVAFDIAVDESSQEQGLSQTIHLVSKAVEGKFPNYKIVIPEDADQTVAIDRETLRENISRAALVVTDKSQSITMTFSENQIVIKGQSAEFGESEEKVEIEYGGPETKLTFNPEYLIHPLKVLEDDEVIFEFKNDMSPGVFKNTGHFSCVVMPLRLG